MDNLEGALIERFGRGVDAPMSEEEFNGLALAVFEYQFARNTPYAAVCRLRRLTPERVGDWREIPPLSTAVFKVADLATVPPDDVHVVYHTSGTSLGETTPGRHLLPNTRLYDASLEPNFQAHLLPDRESMRILVCGPTARFFPHSSLGHMHSRLLERFGEPGSGVFWRDDGPRFGCLASALEKAEAQGTPVCLLGTAFGFVCFLDWLSEHRRTFRLPDGSRLMDTGGYKGRSREVPKPELYAAYTATLGVPPTHIVNEYGMTEMGSQFYDQVLRENRGVLSGARRKVGPPWVRWQVVDPDTLRPVPDGQIGLLRFFDLANLHSVAAIQTDDLGVCLGSGFEILGRAAGAEPRGCSLAAG